MLQDVYHKPRNVVTFALYRTKVAALYVSSLCTGIGAPPNSAVNKDNCNVIRRKQMVVAMVLLTLAGLSLLVGCGGPKPVDPGTPEERAKMNAEALSKESNGPAVSGGSVHGNISGENAAPKKKGD
jgi:hypothetical protein